MSGSSSTRMGKRPCSSGMRSEALATWNAPAAMKSTWSVFTDAVLRVDGRALDDGEEVALHALARDVGAVPPASRPAILSISSMKTMPAFSARSSASRTTRSMSTSGRPPPARGARAPPSPCSRRFRFFGRRRASSRSGCSRSTASCPGAPAPSPPCPGRHERHHRRGGLSGPRPRPSRRRACRRAAARGPSPRPPAACARLACSAGPRRATRWTRAAEPEPEAGAAAERVEHPLLGRLAGPLAELLRLLLLHELHRGLDEVADHRVDVAARRSRPR